MRLLRRDKPEEVITLTTKVEHFDMSSPNDRRWEPTEGGTMVGEYGKGTPTPSSTLEEMAHKDVAEHYPYLLKGSEAYNRRHKEFLAKY